MGTVKIVRYSNLTEDIDKNSLSVDVENETKIQKALSTLIRGKTVIIIAHRMRTILGADHVVVLKEGKLIEEGAPKNLIMQKGLFAEMVHLQRESTNWTID